MLCAHPAAGYSLLTHEQLIDLSWKDSIVPLLLSRYPNLTPAELDRARAYVHRAIAGAPGLGRGHGPLDHAHPLRP